jgi:replicative DNA helicase
MINEDIKQKIKEHLEDYLTETGRNTRGLFNCLNPSHDDKNPSMSYNPKKKEVHCFSCNTNYDLISLYALDNGFLDDKDYFIRSCKELAQKYNISVPVYQSATRGTSETPTTTKEDFTRYYNKCKKAIGKTDYLLKRGISEELQQKYNIGYDEKEKRVIFPLSKNSYVARSTEQNPYIKHFKPKGSTNVIFNDHYLKDSQFNSVVWVNESIIDALSLEAINEDIKAISLNSTNNARQLIQEAKDNNFKGVFILALDTDTTGINASNELKEELEAIGIKSFIFNSSSDQYNINTTFKDIITKDNLIEEENHYIDEEIKSNGEEWGKNRDSYLRFRILGDLSEEYKNKIREKNIINKIDDIIKEELGDIEKTDKTQFNFKYDDVIKEQITIINKDINEYYLSDENKLKSNVDYFNNAIKEMLEQQALKVYEKENVLNYLDEFNDYINDQDKHKPVSTGILSLDKALDGGFYKKNLVILGAISSLGKTTLALQVADNMARSGNDVLIFSLEMAKEELIAKSLSRLSFLKAYDHHYTALALSTRDVMTGKGLISENTPSNQRQQFYSEAVQDYKDNLASHIYITECNDTLDISIKTIDEKIKRHIAITNKKPFVVIDYLQIIQDTDKYINDKQKIDKVLSNLKRIARENDIIIFLISSLNRGAYTQEISLDSFKDSGNIEYTADILLGLQLQTDTNINNEENSKKVKEQINKGQQKEDRELTLKVLKNRNGRITDIKGIIFHARYNYMDFKNADDNTSLY